MIELDQYLRDIENRVETVRFVAESVGDADTLAQCNRLLAILEEMASPIEGDDES